MEEFIRSEFTIDDLLQCCENLAAIGDVLSTLHFYRSGKGGEGTETFERTGDKLGRIIEDYARAINTKIEEASPILRRYFEEGGVTILASLKKQQEIIKEGSLGLHGNLSQLRKSMADVDKFVDGDLKEIFEIRRQMESEVQTILLRLNGSDRKRSGHRNSQGDQVDDIGLVEISVNQ